MEDNLPEDNLGGKMTTQEDNLIGRQSQRKTTSQEDYSQEDYLTGRQPNRKTTK